MSRPINDDVFRAIAHPVRRRILELLRMRDRFVSEIVEEFEMTPPAISQHLRVLRSSGLVAERRARNRRIYRVRPAALAAIEQWTARLRSPRRPPA